MREDAAVPQLGTLGPHAGAQEWEEGCLGVSCTEGRETGYTSSLPLYKRERRRRAGAGGLGRDLTSLSLSFLICKIRARLPFSGLIRGNV